MSFTATRVAVAGVILSGLLIFPGCKPTTKPEPVPEQTSEPSPAPVRNPSKPSAIVEPPQDSVVSAPTPAAASREVYIVTAFQAVSDVGTHDFPAGAKVKVLGEEGEDYLIEYNGVSVRNHRSNFSDTLVEPAATPALAVEDPSPTPVATDALAPDTIMTEEDRKNARTLEDIRVLNDEIRTAQDKDEKATAEKLKKRRDQLSEDLTKTAKP